MQRLIKKRKLFSFLSLVFVSTGGALIYTSSNDYFSVGADSLNQQQTTGTIIIVLSFILGIILVVAGVMAVLFVIASKSVDY